MSYSRNDNAVRRLDRRGNGTERSQRPTEQADREEAIQALLAWYAEHRRRLPWRDPEPGSPIAAERAYAVVVAEFMLQQTQVDRVAPIYEKFLERFPSFDRLASAPVGEVIRAWAGLGYNRRAVNLHRLARQVVSEHRGKLPDDPEELRRLPGVGPYTVAAIRAFVFGHDEPALDTNVRRVLRRLFFDVEPSAAELEDVARATIPPGRAAEWNQALMDLGATLCTARSPRCLICPLQPWCRSAGAVPPSAVRRQGPYEGSRRFYRGRLVAALREQPAAYAASLATLEARLAERGVSTPPEGWQPIAEELARDGLVSLEGDPADPHVRLP